MKNVALYFSLFLLLSLFSCEQESMQMDRPTFFVIDSTRHMGWTILSPGINSCHFALPLQLTHDGIDYFGVEASLSASAGWIVTSESYIMRNQRTDCSLVAHSWTDTIFKYAVYNESLSRNEIRKVNYTTALEISDSSFVGFEYRDYTSPALYEMGDTIHLADNFMYADRYLLYQYIDSYHFVEANTFCVEDYEWGKWNYQMGNGSGYIAFRISNPSTTYIGWIEVDIARCRFLVKKVGYRELL